MVIAVFALVAGQLGSSMPAPSWHGPTFSCGLTSYGSGETFTVSGRLGEGIRFNSPRRDLTPTWNYRHEEARVADPQLGFADRAEVAVSSVDFDRHGFFVRYGTGSAGRRLSVSGVGEGRRARLTGEGVGTPDLAHGTCTIANGSSR